MPPMIPFVNPAKSTYAATYSAARQNWVHNDRYSGYTFAMTRLWDSYSRTLKDMVCCPDIELAAMFYWQACALWSLYTNLLTLGASFCGDGDIPF